MVSAKCLVHLLQRLHIRHSSDEDLRLQQACFENHHERKSCPYVGKWAFVTSTLKQLCKNGVKLKFLKKKQYKRRIYQLTSAMLRVRIEPRPMHVSHLIKPREPHVAQGSSPLPLHFVHLQK